jgi:CheY-like chemotaxis protein
MTSRITKQPRAVLVDDDIHSARLLVRTLSRLGGPALTWYGRAERSLRLLTNDFASLRPGRPQAIVVDLKGSSAATATFIRRLRERLPAALPIIAMAAAEEAPVHEAILAAGATAIFLRGADAAAYRGEVARLAAFLVPRLARGAHRAAAAEPAAPTLIGLDSDHEAGPASDGSTATPKFNAHANTAAAPTAAPATAAFNLPGRRTAHGSRAGESEPFFV